MPSALRVWSAPITHAECFFILYVVPQPVLTPKPQLQHRESKSPVIWEANSMSWQILVVPSGNRSQRNTARCLLPLPHPPNPSNRSLTPQIQLSASCRIRAWWFRGRRNSPRFTSLGATWVRGAILIPAALFLSHPQFWHSLYFWMCNHKSYYWSSSLTALLKNRVWPGDLHCR